MDPLLAAVEGYYTDKMRSHGPTPRGVDWNGIESQEVRFDRLLAVMDTIQSGFSLIDYGCGYGALLDTMVRRYDNFEYMGYDVSSAMIEEAQNYHGDKINANFTSSRSDLHLADFTVASGIFNVKLGAPRQEWLSYILTTINEMVELSRCGIAFNALTSHSDADRKRTDLYYADPSTLLNYCLRKHSRNVELNHNYDLFEFTLLVRLDGRGPATSDGREER